MIEKKRIEEQSIRNHRFKAKRPPKEVVTPMYNQIITKKWGEKTTSKSNFSAATKRIREAFFFLLYIPEA